MKQRLCGGGTSEAISFNSRIALLSLAMTSTVFYFFILAAAGCSNSDSLKIPDAFYFPLRTGNFQIYQVSETDILQLTCGDGGQTVKNYQLKVLMIDSIKNSDGSYSYTIHRFTRPDSTQAWKDLDTWSARKNASELIVNEGNTPFVRFVFPITNNGKWNGNKYNDLGTEDYTSSANGKPYTLNTGKKFANTFTVTQSDNHDLFVYQDKRMEVYAVSVGLVYKSIVQLHYFTDSQCYGQQKVKSGILYEQTLISDGHE